MLEQIMSSDNVADGEKDAEQSSAPRTPNNMSPRRTNG